MIANVDVFSGWDTGSIPFQTKEQCLTSEQGRPHIESSGFFHFDTTLYGAEQMPNVIPETTTLPTLKEPDHLSSSQDVAIVAP